MVAKDRVVLWHDCGSKWNGEVAAELYAGPVAKALRRTWGMRKSYTIVEDGDRKGYQTKKAIAAKEKANIKSLVLPPRSPSLMPLDARIWKKVDELLNKTAPEGRETAEQFNARLKLCAQKIPKSFVTRSISRMKDAIQAIVDAKGYIPRDD